MKFQGKANEEATFWKTILVEYTKRGCKPDEAIAYADQALRALRERSTP